jgi:hypothetical protein
MQLEIVVLRARAARLFPGCEEYDAKGSLTPALTNLEVGAANPISLPWIKSALTRDSVAGVPTLCIGTAWSRAWELRTTPWLPLPVRSCRAL